MQALGLIETKGLLPAIVCADAMLKTALVELVERTFVGGGLVTVTITGEVSAVKAAVEAGAAVVDRISCCSLVSQHVIARPHNDIESIITRNPESIITNNPADTGCCQDDKTMEPEPRTSAEPSTPAASQNKNTNLSSIIVLPKDTHKQEVDELVRQFGLDKIMVSLEFLSVVRLRKLAREYQDPEINTLAAAKANKETLIQKLKEYYQNQSTQ